MSLRAWLPRLFAAAGIIGLAAGLLWWGQDSGPSSEQPEQATVGEAPQLIVTDLYRITTRDNGTWLNTVEADRARYNDSTDRLSLTQPRIQGDDGNPFRIRAESATLDEGSFWTLRSDVVLIADPNDERPTTIRTDYLEYDTVADTAHTPEAVTIEQTDRMLTTAIGMDLYLTPQEYELHEQVRTRYLPAD